MYNILTARIAEYIRWFDPSVKTPEEFVDSLCGTWNAIVFLCSSQYEGSSAFFNDEIAAYLGVTEGDVEFVREVENRFRFDTEPQTVRLI